LTGGIASGKSTAAQTLRALGAPVMDADALSRALTAPGGVALPALRNHFGDAVFTGEALNRPALAARVFADAHERAALESILHPLIFAALDERLAELALQGAPAAVVEMPLLFETGYDARVDEVWLTCLPLGTQRLRLMRRDALTGPQADARIASQWPQEAKAARAHVHIDTSGAPDDTAAQVQAAWRAVIHKTHAAAP
jgi:dephospho-CoA kinase